jgi:hypothetical protein
MYGSILNHLRPKQTKVTKTDAKLNRPQDPITNTKSSDDEDLYLNPPDGSNDYAWMCRPYRQQIEWIIQGNGAPIEYVPDTDAIMRWHTVP